jgi:5-methylcytosine-specific restriction endonuclease McrA
VWERDGGRCQWPIEGGGICASTLRLEIDHVVPRGMGGGSDAANLRLLCRFHNQRAARTAYGDAVMDRFAGRAPRAREAYAAYGPDC